jgi:AcrR family transcriptional regulator
MDTPRPASEKRKKEILEAALDCFAQRGYAATTLDDIRARSGASTGSIYHLFAGKEEIGGALYLEGLRAWQDGFRDELRAHATAEAGVRAIVGYYLGWIAAQPKLARFILHTRQAELSPSIRDEVRALNRAFFREVKEHLEPQVASGRVRNMPLELFHAVVIGPCLEYARQWLGGLTKVAPAEAREHLADAAWAAVRRPR